MPSESAMASSGATKTVAMGTFHPVDGSAKGKAFLDLGPLKATAGMQDFVVPAAMTAGAMGYHTVVLWDSQMVHAVAAAPLKP